MAELKPCPFCGGEVSIGLTGHGNTNWFFVTRGYSKTKKNCKCRLFMESDRYFLGCLDTKEAKERVMKDLIEAWNRRAGDGNHEDRLD
jgi:hypothetical protein